jgi:hypothetical protein
LISNLMDKLMNTIPRGMARVILVQLIKRCFVLLFRDIQVVDNQVAVRHFVGTTNCLHACHIVDIHKYTLVHCLIDANNSLNGNHLHMYVTSVICHFCDVNNLQCLQLSCLYVTWMSTLKRGSDKIFYFFKLNFGLANLPFSLI